jgi:hypothetical protein
VDLPNETTLVGRGLGEEGESEADFSRFLGLLVLTTESALPKSPAQSRYDRCAAGDVRGWDPGYGHRGTDGMDIVCILFHIRSRSLIACGWGIGRRGTETDELCSDVSADAGGWELLRLQRYIQVGLSGVSGGEVDVGDEID